MPSTSKPRAGWGVIIILVSSSVSSEQRDRATGRTTNTSVRTTPPCTGTLSRNHSVGMRLGRGETLATILDNMQAVAEGVRTAHAALGLARRYGIDMPITQEINAVLFEGKSCRKAVSDLMEREAKPEKGQP